MPIHPYRGARPRIGRRVDLAPTAVIVRHLEVKERYRRSLGQDGEPAS